jgi:hypothetical protein
MNAPANHPSLAASLPSTLCGGEYQEAGTLRRSICVAQIGVWVVMENTSHPLKGARWITTGDTIRRNWIEVDRPSKMPIPRNKPPIEEPAAMDLDLGQIGPGHVCKHGVRWPHPCNPCDDAAWAHLNCASPNEHAPSTSDGLGHRSSEG